MTDARIDWLLVSAHVVPTDQPEADGTLAWDRTTLVLVRLGAGGRLGVGYTYSDAGLVGLIERLLAPCAVGRDALDIPAAHASMQRVVRNLGHSGLAASAIAAVDNALWDLKAKLLGLSLADLLGRARGAVEVYGSGGFTTYSLDRLTGQLAHWVEQGMRQVKMKIGADPAADLERVRAARQAIGPGAELYVDANGAYRRKQALAFAEAFAEHGVTWFEEPVSSDDLGGLRLMRDRVPPGMEVAAGEYGYDIFYFRRMLEAGAVDVLQIDATRCAGITGFLKAAALAEAFGVPVSAHTAPALHLHPCCAVGALRPLEYFHDHVRIESMLFEGTVPVIDGCLTPDASRPGLGLEPRASELKRTAVGASWRETP